MNKIKLLAYTNPVMIPLGFGFALGIILRRIGFFVKDCVDDVKTLEKKLGGMEND